MPRIGAHSPARCRGWSAGRVCIPRPPVSSRHPGTTAFKLSLPQPKEFTLYLRVPTWSNGATIKVNGRDAQVSAQPGTFAAIRRTWKDGDTVDLTLPLTYRTAPVDDKHPDVVALMRGPVMLVATPDATPTLPANFVAAANDAGRPADRLPGSGARMIPFYKVRDEAYTTYLALG